jgi:hypothetical protein
LIGLSELLGLSVAGDAFGCVSVWQLAMVVGKGFVAHAGHPTKPFVAHLFCFRRVTGPRLLL